MKNYYLITKEATKYWKKAIKNDRVMVTNHDDKIYVVNGYNAFIFPALPVLWDELARPAFLQEMPDDGASFQYLKGEKQPAVSMDIVNIMERNLQDETAAARTPFTYDTKNGRLRLYKNANNNLIGVNVIYDSMVDHERATAIYCGGRYSPVVFRDEHFTALIMPVKMSDNLPGEITEVFCKYMEEK